MIKEKIIKLNICYIYIYIYNIFNEFFQIEKTTT